MIAGFQYPHKNKENVRMKLQFYVATEIHFQYCKVLILNFSATIEWTMIWCGSLVALGYATPKLKIKKK